jgi:transposase
MDDANAPLTVEGLRKLVEQLRAENAALRSDNAALIEQHETAKRQLAQAQAELEALAHATSVLDEDRGKLRNKVAELQAAVNRLTDMLWGRRSEKRPDKNQPTLFDLRATPDDPSQDSQALLDAEKLSEEAQRKLLEELLKRRKRRLKKRLEARGREEFPDNLERRHVKVDLDESAKAGLTLFKTVLLERLCFERPHMYIEVIERFLYVKAGVPEAGIIAPPAPLGILPGVKYDFSVIAAALSMKLSFHQPTYRQQDIFAQAGFALGRSTLNDLFNYSVIVAEPLFDETWRTLLRQSILLGDDTRIRLLTRGALTDEEIAKLSGRANSRAREGPPGSVNSFAWLYTGLNDAPYNIFHWALTRENSCIDSHLLDFHGVFVGDAAGPNARLEQRSDGRIIHAGCNAHARREFVAAEKTHALQASKALAFYRLLYDVERFGQIADDNDEELLARRQRDAVPIWNAFRQWLDSEELKSVLPKSPLGKALTYINNQWECLQRYASDPRLPIDNNQSERTIRPLVIGRRNWTFLGHPRAAAGRLQLFSIASSAHRHGLIMMDYLQDVLKKLAEARQRRPYLLTPGSDYLRDLLPDRWAKANPSSVNRSRLDEREDLDEVKQIRFLKRQLKLLDDESADDVA